MKTMTILNVPDVVSAGILDASQKKNDFSAFCGGWSAKEYAAFEKATARTVNPEDWNEKLS